MEKVVVKEIPICQNREIEMVNMGLEAPEKFLMQGAQSPHQDPLQTPQGPVDGGDNRPLSGLSSDLWRPQTGRHGRSKAHGRATKQVLCLACPTQCAF